MLSRTPQIIVTRAVNHPCACCMSEKAFHITAANGGGTATGISLCRQCMQTVLWEVVKLETAPNGVGGCESLRVLSLTAGPQLRTNFRKIKNQTSKSIKSKL